MSESATAAGALLAVAGLNAWYGDAHILFDLSFSVAPGEVVALTGRNGAGKSTTLKSIMGLVARKSGSITFAGRSIADWPAYRIARAGLGYVPEERRIFTDLTVLENLETGRQPARARPARSATAQIATARGTNVRDTKVRDTNVRDTKIRSAYAPGTLEPWTPERLFELFPNLATMPHRRGQHMSGGEQQMLTIARTLMGNPSLVLLDEPSEGVAPIIVEQMAGIISSLKQQGLAVLLSEQNERFVERVSDRALLLEQGHLRVI